MSLEEWNRGQLFLLYAGTSFALLLVGTTLGPLQWIPTLQPWLKNGAEWGVQWSAHFFWGKGADFYAPMSSDSLGLLIHGFNVLLLSLVLGGLLIFVPIAKEKAPVVYYSLRAFLSYYLALQLFLYGFNKVFKFQFYLPEPLTLYTTVGETPRDLLFWSVMGSAYGYTVFAGVLEVLAAVLLLFRKTRLVGALMALVLFTHIVAVNFGFNISVKFYSLLFWAFTVVILLPHLRRLYAFLIQNKWIAPNHWQPSYKNRKTRWLYASIKTLVVGLLLLESLYPYFKANNFNDDLAARPTFHGAYQVESFVKDQISYPDQAVYTDRWYRAFVHRRGHFVVQYENGKTQDYELAYDASAGLWELIDIQTKARNLLNYYILADGSLRLVGKMEGAVLEVFLKKLDWRNLPLLQQEFYWTIDEIKAE